MVDNILAVLALGLGSFTLVYVIYVTFFRKKKHDFKGEMKEPTNKDYPLYKHD